MNVNLGCKSWEGHDTLGTIDKGNVNVALIGLHACCWHLLVPFHSSKIPYLSEKGTSKQKQSRKVVKQCYALQNEMNNNLNATDQTKTAKSAFKIK